ncbi:hypothetical protein JCM33374_g6303 [Metschnikowia sp. JCM 33374]|nr:hypothetical protein JCM33374_g6303 [Metschnikowia sp. JCM 33374]
MKLLLLPLYTFSAFFPLVASLNILISSTDSWVDKNARYLYPALVEAGHRVVYVGPLHSHLEQDAFGTHPNPANVPQELYTNTPESDIDLASLSKDGGDFFHLKESNQKYFSMVRKLNLLTRGAKKVISKQEAIAFDKEASTISKSLVRTSAYGQDPLNPDFWYVNGSPLEALSLALDAIIPQHLPQFSPDLVVIGPNEGLHLTRQPQYPLRDVLVTDLLAQKDELEAMRVLAQLRNFPVISVSTEDAHRIYYEDEDLFNVEQNSYNKSFKQNFISQNIQFVNSRLMKLISKVVPHMKRGQALNVNFPSMNSHSSSCKTKGDLGPNFRQISNTISRTPGLGSLFSVPKFAIENGSVVLVDTQTYKASKNLASPEKVPQMEVARLHQSFKSKVEERDSVGSAGFTGSEEDESYSQFQQRSNTQNILTEPKYSDNEDINEIICNAREYKALLSCEISVAVNDLARGSSLDESVLDVLKYL